MCLRRSRQVNPEVQIAIQCPTLLSGAPHFQTRGKGQPEHSIIRRPQEVGLSLSMTPGVPPPPQVVIN
jgi:hypothetical protein